MKEHFLTSMNPLPIDTILPDLRARFIHQKNIVLSAEPGAGKTTRVPLSLLNEVWIINRKIIMLEPRRLAAIRSAEYMSSILNETPGKSIGYRIRGENKIGPRTRIEVVTEGILTRMIQSDPSLADVGLVIFDEFHERSIHADLGLALTLDVQQQIRNDLRILVMSATLKEASVSTLLNNDPILRCPGRVFPVKTIYRHQQQKGLVEPLIVSTILTAIREEQGDILVFLPGQREIRRTEELLRTKELPAGISLHVLFGDAAPEQQKAALAPAPPGRRKVILSTSIAETSLTIDGVCIVIDSGLVRRSAFDSKRGMSGLVTTPVSISTADQRRGRAGRQQPGVCYRLWTKEEELLLPDYPPAEITIADLSSFTLELYLWGEHDTSRLSFIDTPPEKHLQKSKNLLKLLSAIGEDDALTSHGKILAASGIHPRLSHMIIKGKDLGLGDVACTLAALLEEKDLVKGKDPSDVDVYSRYQMFVNKGSNDGNAIRRITEQINRLRNEHHITTVSDRNAVYQNIGILIALAYPERIAKKKVSSGKYQLMGNTVALLPNNSSLSGEEYLAVAEVDGIGNEVKIFLASPIDEESIVKVFSDRFERQEETLWDEKLNSIISRSVIRFGAITLSEKMSEPDAEKSQEVLYRLIRENGLSFLPWDAASESFRVRSEWIRKNSLVASGWIDLSDRWLLENLEEWLGVYLANVKTKSQIMKLDMPMILKAMFTYENLKTMDALAPTHHIVPTGSKIPIDYTTQQPFLSVRIQEMFGETQTPTVGGGRINVVLHLLSPARRPLAVTQDLPSFWKNSYADVRKEMRGRYPKHYWPEDPLVAEPTKRTKKFM